MISHAPQGSIASEKTAADVIIHASTQQIDSDPATTLVRPLAKEDVEHFVWDWGDKPTGRFSGFYCSLQSSLFDPRRHRTFCYPILFNEMVEEFSQTETTYNFGFMGGITAGVRERLFRVLKSREHLDNSIYKVQGADWATVFDRRGGRTKEEYAEFLRATRFVLCPRGYGVGSARLFETMKAGRVPVIISDGYVPPTGIDWKTCSITLNEKDISKIPATICPEIVIT